ncbi:hypothetical protein AXK11_06450 [Cephaloticoccus primus]|uniref:Glycosyltransferase RgtA/B/C/D-like domain-containing protein n=1 Tax=Cephaloticoccus primus TaxID=1548207 RepID=A0A139SLI6_9BACT|nr:hypothetical protein AXK11_06450 [Cephaloticoccus primus]
MIGALFLGYIVIRALHVGAVYDEVMTIETAEKWQFWDILINRGSRHANNHVLNTLLVKSFFYIGNVSLFWARLPNVISFAFYAYFLYKIALRNLSTAVGIGLFVLALANPFLLEFFGLARGYGLSIAFMMGSLYFASEDFKSPSVRKFLASIFLAGLSAVSVFSMLYFFLALTFILNLVPVFRKDAASLKKGLGISCSVGAIFLCFILPVVFRLHKYGQLYYGGVHDFYNDTLFSLAKYSLGSLGNESNVYLALNFLLLSLGVTVSAALFFKREWISLRNVFVGLTTFLVVTIVAAYYLAGARYPIDRVALFLYPLLVILFCFCLNDLGGYLRGGVISLLVLACGINFTLNANFYKVGVWDYEAHTRQILEKVNEEGRRTGRTVNLVCSTVLGKVVEYYVNSCNYSYVHVLGEGAGAVSYADIDFYILFSREFEPLEEMKDGLSDPWREFLNPYKKDVFLEYPKEDIYVLTNFRTSD